jgi:SAM-dependent methyltransferase
VGLLLNPSAWIVRWAHLLEPQSTVLDVACGSGRHLQWFADRGHRVTGVDRDIDQAYQRLPGAELVCTDIESDPWPLAVNGHARTFGAVIVTNYLWRPLMPAVLSSVAPGGVLLYETFASGNEKLGRPARADFLLQPGELLRTCVGLQVVAYENGFLENPPRFVQRIAAVRPQNEATPLRDSSRCAL